MARRKRLYIAGKMRGLEGQGFARFFAAEELLTPQYVVFNPARADVSRGIDPATTADDPGWVNGGKLIRAALEIDTQWICRHADGIALIDGWSGSLGVRAEYALAEALGIPARSAGWWAGQP